MGAVLGLIVLSLIAWLAMNLRRVYGQVPLRELKRRANKGDQAAQGLYLVAHHGPSANLFLLSIAAISSIFSVVLASRILELFWAVAYIGGILILLFTPLEFRKFRPVWPLAQKLAPYFSRLLGRLRPLGKYASQLINRHRPVTIHTGVYEKEDLIELIETQKKAANNRIAQAELDIALQALHFGEKKVKDYMTPRRAIKFVGRDEPIGPVLMSELHDSGFSRFPVTGTDENEVVGTLYIKDVVERVKPGVVSNVMSSQVFYVSEDASLEQVLDAFIKTKHHLFMVVNEFEEIVGLITIEDVIEQILGRKIVDEFDKYDDMRAVAVREAKMDRHAAETIVSETDS